MRLKIISHTMQKAGTGSFALHVCFCPTHKVEYSQAVGSDAEESSTFDGKTDSKVGLTFSQTIRNVSIRELICHHHLAHADSQPWISR